MILSIEEQLILVAQVCGAMLLGGVIGFERELVNRPAGFRTHIIVAGACALLLRLGDPLLNYYLDRGLQDVLSADPFRTIEAVVTGIAFLGAGTIIQRQGKLKVHGLTTAASLLFSGSIGMATAVDLWVVAVCLTFLTVLLLRALDRVERWMEKAHVKRDDELSGGSDEENR